MKIEIHWTPGQRTVTWVFEGNEIVKEHSLPVQSAAFIEDPPSVVIVESVDSTGPDNAVVYDVDGRERLRLRPPDLPGGIGFDQVFQSKSRIEAVFVTRQGDFHGVPNLTSGEIADVKDWR
jgi:hypothetical protein